MISLSKTNGATDYIKICDLATDRQVEVKSVNIFYFTPDGKSIFTVGHDNVKIVDLATFEKTEISRPKKDLNAADFSSDGRFVVITALGGGIAKILEFTKLKELKIDHGDNNTFMTFRP